jgi:hypothetical protein
MAMASWISVYCQDSLAKLTAKQLLAGIDVDEDAAEAGEAALAVEDNDDGFIVTYGSRRGVFVRRWADAARVREELEEARAHKGSKAVEERLGKTTEVFGIELGASQLSDFGVVVAYELARYLAQKGHGIICDLDHRWTEVTGGGFADL